MIKIRLENDEKIVTQGAFEEYFEYLGYKIVNDKKQVKNEIVKEENDKDTKEEVKTKKDFTRK